MNPTSPTLPGFGTLLFRDHIIERAFKTAGFMLIVAAGFRFMAPTGPPPPGVDLSFEIGMAKWVPVGALVVGALASLVLAQRYMWVNNVLTNGITLKGMVTDLDVYEREAKHSENAPAFRRTKIRSYYATILYSYGGEDIKVRLRLPGAPSGFQIFKDKETELVVLESAPGKPLLRSVYLRR